MLSILDLMNHYLGFFNVNTRWKGRVYTLLALVGNFYLLFLAYSHLVQGNYLRSVLLALAFLVVLYLGILNFFYYFMKKNFRWDISPMIEKRLGTQESEKTGPQLYVPANGLYTQENVLPTTVFSTPDMIAELNLVGGQLLVHKLMPTDYAGLNEKEQLDRLQEVDVIYANDPGAPLPYFRLEHERDGLAVYGGLNEMLAKRLGRIQTVGLMPISEAMKSYDLFIATAVIVGGEGHRRGRAGLANVTENYELKVTLAYQDKQVTNDSI
jgi:hypothetical protein